MMHRKISDVAKMLGERARGLPTDATRAWERTSAVAFDLRTRAATRIGGGPADRRAPVDAADMTKDELMELARKEDVAGRSSMTKAQLAAALRKVRRS